MVSPGAAGVESSIEAEEAEVTEEVHPKAGSSEEVSLLKMVPQCDIK